MHVHVHASSGEAKFWLEPKIELALGHGFNAQQISAALRLVEEHEDEIPQRGKSTLTVEVTNVSTHGFWLLLAGMEKFVAFDNFPWFRDASIAQLTDVDWPSAQHLYWPSLDIDLAVESIDHPEQFPLLSKV